MLPSSPDPATTATPPPSDHDLLKLLLTHRDIACGHCGYNLRGITSTNCPECSAPLALPTSLTLIHGYGPGSVLIWMVPLIITACLVFSDFQSGGVPLIDRPPQPQTVVTLAVFPLIIAGLLTALMGARRHLSARTHRRYWLYTRAATGVFGAAIIASLLLAIF